MLKTRNGDLIGTAGPLGPTDTLLDTAEAAKRIHKSRSWLEHARQAGTGPRYLKIGFAVRYRPEDIDAWLDAQARTRIWEFGGEAA